MSAADRVKWDRKHAARCGSPEVNPLLRDHLSRAPRGRALDLACGKGQNAVFLAGEGFVVDAVDISAVALAEIQHPRVCAIRVDLDDYLIAPASYALILDCFFYDARLLAGMRAGLIAGGMLIFQTFSDVCRGINPAFTVSPAALAAAFAGFEVSVDEIDAAGILSFVARKP